MSTLHSKHPLFTEDIVLTLPAYFLFMSIQENSMIDEIPDSTAFTISDKHQSNSFLRYGSYKPLSDIDFNCM